MAVLAGGAAGLNGAAESGTDAGSSSGGADGAGDCGPGDSGGAGSRGAGLNGTADAEYTATNGSTAGSRGGGDAGDSRNGHLAGFHLTLLIQDSKEGLTGEPITERMLTGGA